MKKINFKKNIENILQKESLINLDNDTVMSAELNVWNQLSTTINQQTIKKSFGMPRVFNSRFRYFALLLPIITAGVIALVILNNSNTQTSRNIISNNSGFRLVAIQKNSDLTKSIDESLLSELITPMVQN